MKKGKKVQASKMKPGYRVLESVKSDELASHKGQIKVREGGVPLIPNKKWGVNQ